MKKFLIIQTAFIGDAILATALLEKLHAEFPDARLDILVRKGNESLFQSHPFLNECLVWNKKENKYSGLMTMLGKIRAGKYDVVINLQRFAASGFLTAFSRAGEKIGFDKNPFSFLFDKKIPHVIGNGMHETDRCLKTIEHLTDNGHVQPALYPSQSDRDAVKNYCAGNFVTISPASVWFTKQTPKEVWINFIAALNGKKCYLLGGPADAALCEEIAAGANNVEVLAGKLSFLQSAALMRNAQMNYTNDSAPMHLCSAVNAPVTAVFCSTTPDFGFGPLSDRSFVVESHPRPECKPCGLHGYRACPKGHFNCGKIDTRDLVSKITPPIS